MSFKIIFVVACVLFQALQVVSECPNACSAHGKCGAYDMCTCYRNWMANDCSQRICQFARAHVDSPKGDLDYSTGKLSSPDITVIKNSEMYPYGTQEQFPFFSVSNGMTAIENAGHEYRECANKGLCDRTTGTCACFEGYEGSACQRASCPSNSNGVCSGHGTCKTIKELAASDNSNDYFLWDRDITMGCDCDSGYTGADCSEKMCKTGFDPLYFDNGRTKRYGNFTFIFYTQTATTISGNYSIVFTTPLGEAMKTEPIPIGSSCDFITNYLEALPNNVIPSGTVRCFRSQKSKNNNVYTAPNTANTSPYQDLNMHTISAASTTTSAISSMIVYESFTLAFPMNAGSIVQPYIDTLLDGKRPTLYTSESVSTLGYKVFANGFSSEEIDYVSSRCDGVTVTLANQLDGNGFPIYDYLAGLDTQSTKLLKTCLGGSDADSTNNVDVYNWDYGSYLNPHLIKLQDLTQYSWVNYVTGATGTIDTTNGDPALYKVPITTLCNKQDGDQAKYGALNDVGLCSNVNPAPFYAVMWYDASVALFKIYHGVHYDYSTTTKFAVYTTDGYLQLINPNSKVFTTVSTFTQSQFIGSFYNNLVHTVNTTSTYSAAKFYGGLDCETNPIGSYGANDCLNKGDMVLFMNPDPAKGYLQNPKYTNIYTVEKIYREPKTIVPYETDPANKASEGIRNKIVLNYGLNQEYQRDYLSPTYQAFAYKFHPVKTTNPFGGYKYSTECSARGICDSTTGLCKCFHGYTNDNCDTQNSLAQ